jgi:hypothetical protein
MNEKKVEDKKAEGKKIEEKKVEEKQEERTLIQAIAEDLKKNRPLADIRKEYSEQNFPRLVIETAIDEARQSLDKSKRRFNLTELFAAEEDVPEKKHKEEEKGFNILPIVVIIIIIWLGIMVSFYLATPFGHAVNKLSSKSNTGFTPFCKQELESQGILYGTEVDTYCGIGQAAINDGKTDDGDLRKKCNTLYYRVQEVDSCAATLKTIIDRYPTRANP